MNFLELEANTWNQSIAASKRVKELTSESACTGFSELRTPIFTGRKDGNIRFSWGVIGDEDKGFIETDEVEKVSIYIIPTQSIDDYINDCEGAILPKADTHYEAVYIAWAEGDGEGVWYEVKERLFLENGSREISDNERSSLMNDLLYDYLFTHEQIPELINLEAMKVVVHADIHPETSTITIFSVAYKSYTVKAKIQHIY
jgi:hypothetical protein